MHNYEDIGNIVDRYASEYLGENFQFRKYQKETIIDIILNILNHEHRNYIVEAPTGSGKSIINILSAFILAKEYKLTSYILVSDLFLWEQYESFLKKHDKITIPLLKGQTGNYICEINNQDIKNADCRMASVSWPSLFTAAGIEKNGYTCAYNCKYVKARKRAVMSDTCIMTYQLFMFIMNNPQFNKGTYSFKEHYILFCDECHNIPSIVQMEYAPTINEKDFDKLCTIFDTYYIKNFDLFSDGKNPILERIKYKTSAEMKKDMLHFWEVWKNPESRKDEDYECMKKYINIITSLSELSQDIKNTISIKKLNKQNITKEDINLFKISTWYDNYWCHWEDFIDAIKNTSTDYLLKDITIANDDKHISVAFKCTKEDYLVYRYLLSKAHYKVFCSATVGGKDAYDENMGFRFDIDETKSEELNKSIMKTIPSTFDFSNSPIHFLNKFKMSFREKEISFRHLKNVIYSICNTKFKDQKGMIQTGSYYFAEQLYNDAPLEIKQRMLVYNGAKEKSTMISIHKMSSDTILVGPTLNTGVDLPGDECRFIIILKVPYPSMADKLVKEKLKLFPLWYNSSTSNEIIQGIGRGVRYDGDWCVTYILDACFWSLYLSTKEQYPKELQDRIHII